MALMEEFFEFSLLSKKYCPAKLTFEIESDSIQMRIVAADQIAETCIPRNSSLMVSGGMMTS